MFRSVPLPGGAPGKLRLHSMPGCREPLESVWEQIRREGVHLIVCLAAPDIRPPASNARVGVHSLTEKTDAPPRNPLLGPTGHAQRRVLGE